MEAVMTVDAKSSEFIAMSKYYDVMDDVLSSQGEIHDRGVKYLPSLTDQTEAQYEAYKLRASFPLYTKHVLHTYVGMVQRKDPMIKNVSEEFISNVDGSGTTLYAYIKKLELMFLTYGRAASFIDYSDVFGRTKMLLYPATSIIRAETSVINDVEQYSRVVLEEVSQEPDDPNDEFSPMHDTFLYRVLTLELIDEKGDYVYRHRVYDSDGVMVQDIYPQANFGYIRFIPIVIHGGFDLSYPPLISVADENLNHYRLDADYKHALHFTALPTPYVIGVDPEDPGAPKSIGPSKLWYLPEGGDAGMLEFEGAGIGSIKDAKEESFQAIVTLSSRILASGGNNETATAATIRNAGETANLAELVVQLSDELSMAVGYALGWVTGYSTDNEPSVVINSDFIPTILSGSDVSSYVASYLKGGMSFYTLFQTLKRGEIQESDRDMEDEIKDIVKEQEERFARDVAYAQATGGASEVGKMPIGDSTSIADATRLDGNKGQPKTGAEEGENTGLRKIAN